MFAGRSHILFQKTTNVRPAQPPMFAGWSHPKKIFFQNLPMFAGRSHKCSLDGALMRVRLYIEMDFFRMAPSSEHSWLRPANIGAWLHTANIGQNPRMFAGRSHECSLDGAMVKIRLHIEMEYKKNKIYKL